MDGQTDGLKNRRAGVFDETPTCKAFVIPSTTESTVWMMLLGTDVTTLVTLFTEFLTLPTAFITFRG
jgi:hypothetical protein